MSLNKAMAGLGSGYLKAERSPEELSELAEDFDRWGLAPEAEVARVRYRRSVVNQLLAQSVTSESSDSLERPRTRT